METPPQKRKTGKKKRKRETNEEEEWDVPIPPKMGKVSIEPSKDWYRLVPSSSISDKDRLRLMAWLMEVCRETYRSRATCHLAIYLTDLYLSKSIDVTRSNLQLVAVACMWLAVKIHEPLPFTPTTALDMAQLTAMTFSPCEVVSMEKRALSRLEWRLQPETVMTHLYKEEELSDEQFALSALACDYACLDSSIWFSMTPSEICQHVLDAVVRGTDNVCRGAVARARNDKLLETDDRFRQSEPIIKDLL